MQEPVQRSKQPCFAALSSTFGRTPTCRTSTSWSWPVSAELPFPVVQRGGRGAREAVTYENARQTVYGMPYADWKAKFQKEQPADRVEALKDQFHSTIDVRSSIADGSIGSAEIRCS